MTEGVNAVPSISCLTLMQSCSEWKETIIRAIDLRGEKELSWAIESICWRMVARDAGWKIFGSVNLVMSSVLEGGAGEIKPGREVRSMERGDLDLFFDRPPGEEEADTGGEACRPVVWMGGNCVATDMLSRGD